MLYLTLYFASWLLQFSQVFVISVAIIVLNLGDFFFRISSLWPIVSYRLMCLLFSRA